MPKMKLGELVFERKVWVRKSISNDQVRCLMGDLANGAKFPPLKVDRDTKIIVGGNHRYLAYRTFYGEGWEKRAVDVELLDLPPFDENPQAWFMAALEDNYHLAERLGYSDRDGVLTALVKMHNDPRGWADTPEAQRIRELMHKTPQGFLEFIDLFLGTNAPTLPPMPAKAAGKADEKQAAPAICPVAIPHAKNPTNDLQPQDTQRTGSYNSQIMSCAARLTAILEDGDARYLSDYSRRALTKLNRIIAALLDAKAA